MQWGRVSKALIKRQCGLTYACRGPGLPVAARCVCNSWSVWICTCVLCTHVWVAVHLRECVNVPLCVLCMSISVSFCSFGCQGICKCVSPCI